MGYFNAKIGSNNTGYEEVMGIHGLGEMNENGEMFADYCALNNMVIGGSMYAYSLCFCFPPYLWLQTVCSSILFTF